MTSIDSSSAGYNNAPGTQRPPNNLQFSGGGGKGGGIPGTFLPDVSVPVAGAASQSFVKDWANGMATYGSHSLAAEGLNRVTAPHMPLGSMIRGTPKNKSIEIPPTGDVARSLTYSDIFHLGTQQVSIHKLSADKFSSAVKSNLSQFTDAVKPESRGEFFKDVTPKKYLKETVLKENLKPVKDLITQNPNQEIGTGILRTAAVGLMGLDVVKHTGEAYKQAKAQENGSILGQWRTAAETTKAFCKYSVRDAGSWEAAGVGAAIGKAIIPVALGGISLGGIAVGALAGVATQKVLDKALNTGKHDPINQQAGGEGVEMKENAETSSAGGVKR